MIGDPRCLPTQSDHSKESYFTGERGEKTARRRRGVAVATSHNHGVEVLAGCAYSEQPDEPRRLSIAVRMASGRLRL